MILKKLERDKIDYKLPTFTLDVNQLALKKWPPGLPELEWNYFNIGNVELCVTPETSEEIMRGVSPSSWGSIAYDRLQKSMLFKSRPPGTTLSLTSQESNIVWQGIKEIVFPQINESQFTFNQRSDVTQVFFHTVASGSVMNSAFITNDNDIYNHRTELRDSLGITVLHALEAWEQYQPKYDLYKPKEKDIQNLLENQEAYFKRLREESAK